MLVKNINKAYLSWSELYPPSDRWVGRWRFETHCLPVGWLDILKISSKCINKKDIYIFLFRRSSKRATCILAEFLMISSPALYGWHSHFRVSVNSMCLEQLQNDYEKRTAQTAPCRDCRHLVPCLCRNRAERRNLLYTDMPCLAVTALAWHKHFDWITRNLINGDRCNGCH